MPETRAKDLLFGELLDEPHSEQAGAGLGFRV